MRKPRRMTGTSPSPPPSTRRGSTRICPFDTVGTGEYFSLPLRLCLTNLFQHQIHHRGQVHNMLSQAGIAPPPLDIVKFGAGEP